MSPLTRTMFGLLSAQLGMFGCLSAGSPAHAQGARVGAPKSSKELTSKVTSVTIFKNGTGYFVRESRLRGSGWVHTTPPPGAVLGSLWTMTRGARVDGLISRRVLADEKHPCANGRQIMDANPGASVRLYLKDKRIAEGVVIKPAQPVKSDRPGSPFSPGFVTLKTRTGFMIVPRHQILRVEFKSEPRRMCVTKKYESRLHFHVKRARAGAVLRTAYVQGGIQWTPTYRLALDRAVKNGRLEMQAVIVNRMEKIENTDIRLVVGVPNLVNKSHLSPLAAAALGRGSYRLSSWQRYRRWNKQGRYARQNYGNVRRTQSFGGGGGGSGGTQAAVTIRGQGAKTGNLYVYSVGRATLRKNERAILPVMQGRFPVRTTYRWEPGPAREKQAWHRRRFRSVATQTKDRVWEYLEIRNSSKVPLTTGPVLMLKGGQLLGQDVLRYTPAGAKTEVPVNVAANVLSDQVRTEVGRRAQAKKIRYRWYAKVTYRVTLKIVNHERKAIRVKIRKNVAGRVESAPGATWRRGGASGGINAKSQLTYQAAIGAGKTWKADFTVSVFK